MSEYHNEGENSHSVIVSYVLDRYMISTIHRESSVCIIPAPWFYETMIWEWDKEKRARKEGIIHESNSGNSLRDSLATHHSLCKKLALGEEV